MILKIIVTIYTWLLMSVHPFLVHAVLRPRCLTGYMTDTQTWVNTFGNLTTNCARNNTLDMSHHMQHVAMAIERFIFSDFRRPIKYLSLAKCRLNRVPTVFQIINAYNLSLAGTVEYMTLFGNEFYDISTDGEHYDVDITANFYREVEIDGFQRSPITSTWAVGFRNVNFTSLRELDLRNCRIQMLSGEIFSGMAQLEALYLGENQIKQINELTFYGLWNLLHLDLSANSATDGDLMLIDPSLSFESLRQLKSLDFSHTKLDRRSLTTLTTLPKSLHRISLCHSAIGTLPDNFFQNTSIKYLDVSWNMGIFNTFSLYGLENTLEIMYANDIGLKTAEIFKNFRALDILQLRNNEINVITTKIAKGLERLRVLDLSNNRITSWFNSIFAHMKKLQFLALRDNNINMISEAMIEDFADIAFLSLSGNKFVCNCHSRELFEIGLRNELLQKVEYIKPLPIMKPRDKHFAYTTAIQDINSLIQGRQNLTCMCENAVNCDKNVDVEADGKFLLVDFHDDMYRCLNVGEGQSVVIRDSATCSQIKREMLQDDEKISDDSWLYALISIPTVLVVVLVVCYVFRWNIRYCYITMRNSTMLSLISKEDSLDKNGEQYSYDVFVSYCNEDRNWVLDYLLPHVEEECNVSVCLHERDFQVGLSILENIVSCMDRSRTIMLIISKKFLLSQWCQFEMHLAQHRLLETRREDLILVLLEDIPRRSRPTTLHYLMVTKTYIVWPRQPADQALFFRRLHNTLLQYRLKQHANNITLA